MILRILIFTYLIVKFLSVYSYKDPQINGYELIENRFEMSKPLNMVDYHLDFYFGFMSAGQAPVRLDPQIGSFAAKKIFINNAERGFDYSYNEIRVEEVDLSKNLKAQSHFPYYTNSPRGIYKIADMS